MRTGFCNCAGIYLPGNVEVLAAGGTLTESINLFAITGTVEITSLFCEVTTVFSAGALDTAFFNLYDGAAAVAITLNDGVVSSLGVGSVFGKTGLVTETMSIISNADGVVTEHATEELVRKRFIVTQKTGQATYIRFTYTNDNVAAATGGFRPIVYWLPVTLGATVTRA
jgi:hypothetical protein